MFELIYITIAMFGLTACGLWDLKTSNVPDKICYVMIALGIILHGVESYTLGSFAPLTNSLLVGTIFLVYSVIMYYSGYWGGGDGELLVVVGFLVPTASTYTVFPFPLTYFINLTIVSAVFSIFYLVYLLKAPGIKRKGFEFYRRIPSSKLQVDDVIGEDFPKLKIFKRKIRGLTAKEISKIRKSKKYVIIREGIRSGITFPIALAITLYFGDLILFLA